MHYTSLFQRQFPQLVSAKALLASIITVTLLATAIHYLDQHYLYLLLILACAALAIVHRVQQFSADDATQPGTHSRFIGTDGGTFSKPDGNKTSDKHSSHAVVFDGGNFVRVKRHHG